MIEKERSWIPVAVDAVVVVFGLICFLYTLLANPGIPDEIFHRNNDPNFVVEPTENRRPVNTCPFCNLSNKGKYKYSHCNDCNVCVEDLDHHCAFFGKCIAKGNVKTFYLSFLMALVGVIYGMVLFSMTQSVTKKYKE